MADYFVQIIKNRFNLNQEDSDILNKTTRQLQRNERRHYFQHIKPEEKKFKNYLKNIYESLDPELQQQWLDNVTKSMLHRGGEPDISDALVMNIIGRLTVYNHMRVKAENEGARINKLSNFGGMSALIILVIVITALVLFLKGS